jgi:hypothetical protein
MDFDATTGEPLDNEEEDEEDSDYKSPDAEEDSEDVGEGASGEGEFKPSEPGQDFPIDFNRK